MTDFLMGCLNRRHKKTETEKAQVMGNGGSGGRSRSSEAVGPVDTHRLGDRERSSPDGDKRGAERKSLICDCRRTT